MANGTDSRVILAFWLFGLFNNVSFVIILSAALDLVGPSVPKSLVLLADVSPSFLTKLIAPYFISHVSYSTRILVMFILSTIGMFTIALTPSVVEQGGSVTIKLVGVVLSSISSGLGELSMLGLSHFYGPASLAAWGSGTGAAGLVGAGLYILLTSTLGFAISTSLLLCAALPFVMPLSFYFILPLEPLDPEYSLVSEFVKEEENMFSGSAGALLGSGVSQDFAYDTNPTISPSPCGTSRAWTSLCFKLRRARSLFFPYMLPLLLVYIAEYLINQGISPVLIFPIAQTPFTSYRSFYPTYGFIYQLGVFVSRTFSPLLSLQFFYTPSLLQVLNLIIFFLHAIFYFLPGIYIVFGLVFWEGLLGGVVYINIFAAIMRDKQGEEREWSLSATSVSDSAGVLIASFVGILLEPWLCQWNVQSGRPWCQDAGG
ncbi:hypothetical protein K3495_g3234 [Podosphaera aphanis]|nr:hypothetical protein K3495_g3234 [Podosphaera aphanis]